MRAFVLRSAPVPMATLGAFCGRVVMAMAAGLELLPGSNVRSLIDGTTALT